MKWTVSTPEEQDIDSRVIIHILNAIKEDFPHMNSILIARNNNIICEQYYNGYNKNSKHKVGCIFKSVLSAVAGIALKENIIESLDIRLADIFPDFNKESYFKDITLKHVMTKTTGLHWKEPDYDRRYAENMPDDISMVLELEFKNKPGELFEYKPDPQILVYVIEKLTNEKLSEYSDRKLFQPLHITDYDWNTDMNHIENMKITTRDLAKLGQLYLNQGEWEGKMLLSKDYIRESTTGKIHADMPERAEYGYFWWVQEFGGVDVFYAGGFGGQYLFVIPEYNLILVVTSKNDQPHPENKAILRNLLTEIEYYKENRHEEEVQGMERVGSLKLSPEEKKVLLKEIQLFFQEERDETIGIFASEAILNFFIKELGEYIYNKALDDTLFWFKNHMENVEADYYSLYKDNSNLLIKRKN